MDIGLTNMDDFANPLFQARPTAFYKYPTRSDQWWAALQHIICIVKLITSNLRKDVDIQKRIQVRLVPMKFSKFTCTYLQLKFVIIIHVYHLINSLQHSLIVLQSQLENRMT